MAPGSSPAAVEACREARGAVVELASTSARCSPCTIATRSGSASATDSQSRREVPVHGVSLLCSWSSRPDSLGSPDTVGACHRAADSSASPGRRRSGPAARAVGARRSDAAGASRSTTSAPGSPRSRPGRGRRPRVAGQRGRPRCWCRCSRPTATSSVILTKRPETMPSHQGEIAFPGGKLDPALDADLRATALREAHEEIGLDPDAVEIVARLDGISTVASRFVITPFVGFLAGRPAADARSARGRRGSSRCRCRS